MIASISASSDTWSLMMELMTRVSRRHNITTDENRTGADQWRNNIRWGSRPPDISLLGPMPAPPDGERRWAHFTSPAQFLMQAVNRSIRYLGLVHSSIGSMHISLKWSKQVLQEWFEEKMFKFSIFYGRSWHKIKYPAVAVAFPSRCCQVQDELKI